MLGSAGMAAFMASRLSAEMPGGGRSGAPRAEGSVMQLPEFLHAPFAAAMSQAMLLPAFVALFGVVAALFLLGFGTPGAAQPPEAGGGGRSRRRRLGDDWGEGPFVDDDEYVEYVVNRDDVEPRLVAPAEFEHYAPADTVAAVDTDVLPPVTEPPGGAPRPASADPDPEAPHQEWRSILDQLLAEPAPRRRQTGSGTTEFTLKSSRAGTLARNPVPAAGTRGARASRSINSASRSLVLRNCHRQRADRLLPHPRLVRHDAGTGREAR